MWYASTLAKYLSVRVIASRPYARVGRNVDWKIRSFFFLDRELFMRRGQ